MANLRLELPTAGAHRTAKAATREHEPVRAPQKDRAAFAETLKQEREARVETRREDESSKPRPAREADRRADGKDAPRKREATDRPVSRRDASSAKPSRGPDRSAPDSPPEDASPEAATRAPGEQATEPSLAARENAEAETATTQETVAAFEMAPATVPTLEWPPSLSQSPVGSKATTPGEADLDGATPVPPTTAGQAVVAGAEAGEPEVRSAKAGQAEAAGPGQTFASLLDTPTSPSAGPLAADLTAAAKTVDAPAASATASTQTASAPIPLGAVPVTIALRSLQDTSRFDIRLDPIELGRIDVRLDIDKERGTVSADLVVDRPATLALLQRDAGTLQQALSQAGLDASGGISLSLRDGGGSHDRGDAQGGAKPGACLARQQAETTDTLDPSPWRAVRLSGIDIRI